MGTAIFSWSDTLRFGSGACFALLALECRPAPCTCIVKIPQLPPCSAVTPETASGAGEVGIANSSVEADASGETTSTRKVVWNGDSEVGTAKGWADCDRKPQCKSSFLPQSGTGMKKSVGLNFHGEGLGWIGGGWNFFGWWPTDAGMDISAFKSLRVAVRIEAKDAASAPDPNTFTMYLKCSSKKDGCQSEVMNVAKQFNGNLYDGSWHVVTFKLADMSKKPGFDPKTVWELDLSTWSKTNKNFNVYVDNIAFTTD